MKKLLAWSAAAALIAGGFGLLKNNVAMAKDAAPAIKAEAGFAAKVLVPPGTLYDPLWTAPHGDVVWLNDDGGEKDDTGSRIMAVDRNGAVSVVAGLGKFLPITGWDIAPPKYGAYGGQIFTLAQPRTGKAGTVANHIIQRIEPARDFAASKFCTLTTAGQANNGVPGYGVDARFGPDGSFYSGKFFAITFWNDTIYSATADGDCRPFITFDGTHYARPFALRFTPDGRSMLVTVIVDRGMPNSSGAVVSVTRGGKLEGTVLSLGRGAQPYGLAIATEGFGAYGGDVFVSQSLFKDGKRVDGQVVRIDRDGGVHVVASGFIVPVAISFIDNKRLWVSDINGDYIAGGVEAPDGFIVEINAK